MIIREEYRGKRKSVWLLVLDDNSTPALDFLEQLQRTDISCHKKMVGRYQRHAHNGPSRNKRHERHIVSNGNLFEFKANSERLLYFNQPGDRIVLVNGFRSAHQSRDQQRYDIAAALRDQFLEEIR